MCFSAPASFAGSAIIGGIGAAAQKKVVQPNQRLFALIPLLFAVQQLAEGILWITLASGAYQTLENIATYVFLVPALVLWPFVVPLSVYLMEERGIRKRILAVLLAAGGAVSLFYVYCLIFYDVTPQIHGLHILYAENFPRSWMNIFYPFYVIATIAPLFVSSVRRMWVFGFMIAVSYLVASIFFSQYLISVWCFFAAIMSGVIYWVLALANITEREKVLA
ncbi:MAG: hypothetical protein PHT28_00005 [Dehalococcoidales bacterium]|jgi:hypothetical protein|nr:hypothetical protein [Dehalococcoidales bacterium]MDD4229820.1 hypothetical protein [Dehalococcoidales bacterium]MDD4465236.1 hypothetical protein [Dehalococcoidales bacterium]MDD5401643.1 hypothetical protein [Dehalococcoidales bacterium]